MKPGLKLNDPEKNARLINQDWRFPIPKMNGYYESDTTHHLLRKPSVLRNSGHASCALCIVDDYLLPATLCLKGGLTYDLVSSDSKAMRKSLDKLMLWQTIIVSIRSWG